MNLSNIPLSLKALFTGYIVVVGVGLMMAGAQIMLTHGQSDGKPGLSIDDVIVVQFHHVIPVCTKAVC
jgi:hypothetical protein